MRLRKDIEHRKHEMWYFTLTSGFKIANKEFYLGTMNPIIHFSHICYIKILCTALSR